VVASGTAGIGRTAAEGIALAWPGPCLVYRVLSVSELDYEQAGVES
jgi:hypothetical protein